jgi:5-methylcytosine-specific restriction endonuclease McrA
VTGPYHSKEWAFVPMGSDEGSGVATMNNVFESLEEFYAVDSCQEATRRGAEEAEFLWQHAVVVRRSGIPDARRESKWQAPMFVQVLVNFHNKRAKQVGAKGRLQLWEWLTIRAAGGGKCIYCQAPCSPTVEHWLALSRGGRGSSDNIVPACLDCNRSKSIIPVADWAAAHGLDLRAIEARRGAIIAAVYSEGLSRAARVQ